MTLKNAAELQQMREAGQITASIHAEVAKAVAPGVTTKELETLAVDLMRAAGVKSSFHGYRGFPGHICTSVNEQVVHGIPGRRVLRDGDIVAVDISVQHAGFHGDSAWTYPVGHVSEEVARLLRDTEAALLLAVDKAATGVHLGAVSHTVEAFARERGYGIVQGYGGHGVGRQMHEEPHVPNIGDPHRGPKLRTGLTIAIEPMLMLGGDAVKELADGWTVVTADGSWAAHYEHTVAVTPEGGEILTPRLAGVLQ